jgi:ribosomal-protein-alanine N-acetyltransferase
MRNEPPKAFSDVRLPAGRVVLRMLTAADVPALYAVFSDPEVARYWSRPAMTELCQAEEYLQSILEGYSTASFLQLGVERTSDRGVLGTCTLFHFDWPNRRAEIGYALGSTHWGNGWMTEALRALMRYAFEELGLHRLEADIDPRNISSARSLTRMGFSYEGLMRERWIVNGEVSDTGFYGLLQRDWQPRTES